MSSAEGTSWLGSNSPSCASSRLRTSSSISGIRGHRAVDLLVEARGRVLELRGLDRDARQALQAAQQRQRRLRVGHRGDVVRNRRPEARRGQLTPPAGVVDDADDPGRALVAGAAEAEPLDQVGIGGEAGDRHGTRVCDVGDQGAERDHHLHAEPLGGRRG